MIKSENTFAYLCKQLIDNTFNGEKAFSLQAAWCNDGKNISEYFEGWQYYLLKIKLNGNAAEQNVYVLYNYNSENGEWNHMFDTVSLDEVESDNYDVKVLKGIVSLVKNLDSSVHLEGESILRINELINNNLIDDIELTEVLRLE